jgi:hypothetical protein
MSSKKHAKTGMVIATIQGATLAERLTAIRVETQNIHSDALRRERQAIDEPDHQPGQPPRASDRRCVAVDRITGDDDDPPNHD